MTIKIKPQENMSIETEAKKIRRKTDIQRILLQTIAAAGVLSVALLAPNALQVLRMFDGNKSRRQNPKYLFNSAFGRLIEKKFIIVEQTGAGKRVRLTRDGEYALARATAYSPHRDKPKRWDKRWRMVIYDIKEERKITRKKLKGLLQTVGFYKLQDSVWVYPYNCEELVILLKADFKLGSEVLYAVIEKIENDQKIKKCFGIS